MYALGIAGMVLLGAEKDMPWFEYPSKEEFTLRIMKIMEKNPLRVRNSHLKSDPTTLKIY